MAGFGKLIPTLLQKGIIKKAFANLKIKNESSLFNKVKKYSTMKENSIINRQSTNSRNFYKKI